MKKTIKMGRNDPCPCGSRKKYKKCHGASGSLPAQTSTLTLDAVTADALDLMTKWISTVRAITNEVSAMEREKRSRSSRKDVAISRWVIYLGIMLAQVAEGVATLARLGNVRAAVILTRSMYEYQQKAQYFLSHKKEAFEQLTSIVARRYNTLTKLAHPNPQVGVILAADYMEWKVTSGDRNEWSGNKRVFPMHLENVASSKIKMDRKGARYTEEFETAYGVPSAYVHAEPFLMPEIFPALKDDSNWDVRETPIYFDALTAVNAANVHLSNYCLKTTDAYKLDFKRIFELRSQIRRVIESTVKVHALPVRIVRQEMPIGASP